MNRYLALFLVLGIGFWAVFAYRIAWNGKLIGSHAQSVQPSQVEPLPISGGVVADSQLKHLRNPFAMPQVSHSVKNRREHLVKPVEVAKDPLPYTLDAILPGDTPLAILRRGSSTVIAGLGQKAWDATVLHVDAEMVRLEYHGSEYELRK